MDSVKAAVHNVSEAVFPGIHISYKNKGAINRSDEIVTSLPLQMCLYFNVYFSPFWLLIHLFTLFEKFLQLSQLYKILLLTVVIVLTPVEIARLYLGYVGNLTEKVPELAGFWLLTVFLQFPLHCFLLFHEEKALFPAERTVNILMMIFVILEIIFGYLTVKAIARHQSRKFQQHIMKAEDVSPCQSVLQVAT